MREPGRPQKHAAGRVKLCDIAICADRCSKEPDAGYRARLRGPKLHAKRHLGPATGRILWHSIPENIDRLCQRFSAARQNRERQTEQQRHRLTTHVPSPLHSPRREATQRDVNKVSISPPISGPKSIKVYRIAVISVSSTRGLQVLVLHWQKRSEWTAAETLDASRRTAPRHQFITITVLLRSSRSASYLRRKPPRVRMGLS